MNARLTLITLLIYTSIAMVIFIAMKNASDDRVLASVYPRELTVGDVLFYSDSTPYAKSYVWDFQSLGNKSFRAKGSYKYTKPGQYTIVLSINNKVAASFPVEIKEPQLVFKKDTAIGIYAVSEAIVGQSVHFKTLGSDDIETCAWYFGETGKVGSREAEAFHTYYTPGTYKVKLITNLSTEPVYHTIQIKKAYSLSENVITPEAPKTGGGPGDDIKQYLQKIAKGAFSSNYEHILNTFLCNNAHVPVIMNGSGGFDFYRYCQNLQINGGTTIDNVAIEADPSTNCINKLKITQH